MVYGCPATQMVGNSPPVISSTFSASPFCSPLLLCCCDINSDQSFLMKESVHLAYSSRSVSVIQGSQGRSGSGSHGRMLPATSVLYGFLSRSYTVLTQPGPSTSLTVLAGWPWACHSLVLNVFVNWDTIESPFRMGRGVCKVGMGLS